MHISVGGVTVDVVFKDIKNVHLSVHPPTGRVTIAAPTRMSLDTVRLFAIAKVGWIRKQQEKLNQQEREAPREYLSRESHYVWGERYLMKVIEVDAPPAALAITRQRAITRFFAAFIDCVGAEDRGEVQRSICAPHED